MKTAIPQLLATLALEGCIVTLDAMGNPGQHRSRPSGIGVPTTSWRSGTISRSWPMPCATSFMLFETAPERTPHTVTETVEKDCRLETRRCCIAFAQLACLHKPEQWPDLKSFAVIRSARCIKDKTSIERRFYLSSLAPDADRLARDSRAHWSIGNRLHWCMDVAFADDQMRAHSGHAAHNLAILSTSPQPHPP